MKSENMKDGEYVDKWHYWATSIILLLSFIFLFQFMNRKFLIAAKMKKRFDFNVWFILSIVLLAASMIILHILKISELSKAIVVDIEVAFYFSVVSTIRQIS